MSSGFGTATVRSALQAREGQSMEEAFPDVDCLNEPLGNQVIVQMRCAKKKAGSILLVDESKDFDASMVRVAKVIAIGPVAYKNRETFELWPEGAWVKVGDFVRVPGFAGIDSWRIPHGKHLEMRPGGREVEVPDWVTFVSFNDYDIKTRIKGDPLMIVDYV